MSIVKSIIRRNFKTEYFPEKVCMLSNSLYYRLQHTDVEIADKEEIVVTIDNEPNSKVIDCVILTTSRIIIIKGSNIYAFRYDEIEEFELPKEKVKANIEDDDDDYKMNRNDRAVMHLIDGKSLEVRIIYGGIYLLATILKNPLIRK